jgi:hypothetical protein
VSLILEALKKLEREKRSSEPGFLVLGPTSWASASGGGRRAALALAGLALLATTLALMGWRNSRQLFTAGTRAETAASPAPSVAIAALPQTSPPGPAAGARVLQPEPNAATPAREPLEPQGAREPATVESASEPAAQAIAAAPTPSPSAPPRFQLEAISLRDGKPVAVLDGRLVYEGESFDGVRVVRIGEAEVELEVDGRRLVVGF